MRELSDADAKLHSIGFERGYAAGYRAAQAAMPPREPTPAMRDGGTRVLSGIGGTHAVLRIWRAMHDAWTNEQTSGPGAPCESLRTGMSATKSAADSNVGTEDAILDAERNGHTAPGPLDHQNGVQRHEASAGCALGASSLESGNAREATCLSGDHDARQRAAYTAGTVRDHAGSTPAAPTDQCATERDALRECVRAADAMRTLQFDDLWEVREYDRARAAWKVTT